MGDVMYGKMCSIDDDPIDWAFMHIEKIANFYLRAITFMRYIKDALGSITSIWRIGVWHILHAHQNTNAKIESIHSNLKNILNSTNERFMGSKMD